MLMCELSWHKFHLMLNLPLPLIKATLLAFILAASAWVSLRHPHSLRKIHRSFASLASRTWLCLLILALLPIALRLSLLPWFPPPVPRVHDEFSHLLVADTLAHGRLANPTHPFWRHLETNYVLHQPTYASKYPPGIGASMALGQLLTGHPWAGVLLIMGLFCALSFWMLLGWLSPSWAFLGGLLISLRFGFLHYWAESYWGGGVAALGGAIAFGSLARLWSTKSPRYAALLVAGWGLIWFTRPYEAAVCALLLTPLILKPFFRSGFRTMAASLAPAVLIGLAIAAFFFYYNWRITGNPWTMPYQLYQQKYGVPQNFLWQDMVRGPVPEKRNLAATFAWQQQEYLRHKPFSAFLRTSAAYLPELCDFYAGYLGRGLPLLLLCWPPLWRRNPWILILLLILAVSFLASLLYPFRLPHYVAHYTSVWGLLLLFALRSLWPWSWRSLPIGRILVLTMVATTWLQKWTTPEDDWKKWRLARAAIVDKLHLSGRQHLVFVIYSQTHNMHEEWVSNAADIDNSPIVWAQPIDPASDAALMQYFSNRKVWRIHPDEPNPHLIPAR